MLSLHQCSNEHNEQRPDFKQLVSVSDATAAFDSNELFTRLSTVSSKVLTLSDRSAARFHTPNTLVMHKLCIKHDPTFCSDTGYC